MYKQYLFYTSILVVGMCLARHNNYDNFDIEGLLANTTRTKNFFECVTDESKCATIEDRQIKHDMVEMVNTSCSNCSPKEKIKYGEAMQALKRSTDESQIINMFINKMTDMLQVGVDSDSA